MMSSSSSSWSPSRSPCGMECQCCPYKTSSGVLTILVSTIAFFMSFGALNTCHFLTIPVFQDVSDGVVLETEERRSIGLYWSEPPLQPRNSYDGYNDQNKDCIYYTDDENDIELDATFKFAKGIGIFTSVLSSISFLALNLSICCIKCRHTPAMIFFRVIPFTFLLFGCTTGLTFLVIHHSDVCDNTCELNGGGYVMAIAIPLWVLAASSVAFALSCNRSNINDNTVGIHSSTATSGNQEEIHLSTPAATTTTMVTESNFASLPPPTSPLFYPQQQRQQPPDLEQQDFISSLSKTCPTNPMNYTPTAPQAPPRMTSYQEPRVSVPTAPIEEDTTEVPIVEAFVIAEEEPTK